MNISLLQDSKLDDDHLTMRYRQMTQHIEQILDTANESSLINLQGLNEKGDNVFIPSSDILYFETVDRKTFAYMEEGIYEISESLTMLESHLYNMGYIRINKSTIVNIYKINAIRPEANMRVRAVMDNGEYIIINRSYKKIFQNYVKERRPTS